MKRNRKIEGVAVTATTIFGQLEQSHVASASSGPAPVGQVPVPAPMQVDASGVPYAPTDSTANPVTQTPPARGELTSSSHGPWSHDSPQPSLHGPWSHPRAQSSGDIRVSQSQRNRSTSSWDQWSSSEWTSSSDYASGWKRQGRGGVRPAAWSSSSPASTDWSSWNARSGDRSWGTAVSGVNPAKPCPYSASAAQARGRSPPVSGVNPAKEGGPRNQAWTPTLRPSSSGT